jgi:hypothetical protein
MFLESFASFESCKRVVKASKNYCIEKSTPNMSEENP